MYYNHNDKALISLDNLRRIDLTSSVKKTSYYISFTYCDGTKESIEIESEQEAKIKFAVIRKMLSEKN